MDLELADYQRSLQSLGSEVATSNSQLGQARKQIAAHQAAMAQLKREKGLLIEQLLFVHT